MGQNKALVSDARLAVKSQPDSVAAKDTLGKALYSSGQFEKALVEFHKAYRMRPISLYEEWIGGCEETIKAFLTATHIDFDIVEKLLEDEESKNWIDILTVMPDVIKMDIDTGVMTNDPGETLERKKAKETKERNERIIDGKAACGHDVS